ncbi:unnamed protein product [Amoebophrya sp. A120]|nr:unnamed protein product [Amoebophrya sp. A120]|eukprot:GSA120T00013965001.1
MWKKREQRSSLSRSCGSKPWAGLRARFTLLFAPLLTSALQLQVVSRNKKKTSRDLHVADHKNDQRKVLKKNIKATTAPSPLHGGGLDGSKNEQPERASSSLSLSSPTTAASEQEEHVHQKKILGEEEEEEEVEQQEQLSRRLTAEPRLDERDVDPAEGEQEMLSRTRTSFTSKKMLTSTAVAARRENKSTKQARGHQHAMMGRTTASRGLRQQEVVSDRRVQSSTRAEPEDDPNSCFFEEGEYRSTCTYADVVRFTGVDVDLNSEALDGVLGWYPTPDLIEACYNVLFEMQKAEHKCCTAKTDANKLGVWEDFWQGQGHDLATPGINVAQLRDAVEAKVEEIGSGFPDDLAKGIDYVVSEFLRPAKSMKLLDEGAAGVLTAELVKAYTTQDGTADERAQNQALHLLLVAKLVTPKHPDAETIKGKFAEADSVCAGFKATGLRLLEMGDSKYPNDSKLDENQKSAAWLKCRKLREKSVDRGHACFDTESRIRDLRTGGGGLPEEAEDYAELMFAVNSMMFINGMTVPEDKALDEFGLVNGVDYDVILKDSGWDNDAANVWCQIALDKIRKTDDCCAPPADDSVDVSLVWYTDEKPGCRQLKKDAENLLRIYLPDEGEKDPTKLPPEVVQSMGNDCQRLYNPDEWKAEKGVLPDICTAPLDSWKRIAGQLFLNFKWKGVTYGVGDPANSKVLNPEFYKEDSLDKTKPASPEAKVWCDTVLWAIQATENVSDPCCPHTPGEDWPQGTDDSLPNDVCAQLKRTGNKLTDRPLTDRNGDELPGTKLMIGIDDPEIAPVKWPICHRLYSQPEFYPNEGWDVYKTGDVCKSDKEIEKNLDCDLHESEPGNPLNCHYYKSYTNVLASFMTATEAPQDFLQTAPLDESGKPFEYAKVIVITACATLREELRIIETYGRCCNLQEQFLPNQRPSSEADPCRDAYKLSNKLHTLASKPEINLPKTVRDECLKLQLSNKDNHSAVCTAMEAGLPGANTEFVKDGCC